MLIPNMDEFCILLVSIKNANELYSKQKNVNYFVKYVCHMFKIGHTF